MSMQHRVPCAWAHASTSYRESNLYDMMSVSIRSATRSSRPLATTGTQHPSKHDNCMVAFQYSCTCVRVHGNRDPRSSKRCNSPFFLQKYALCILLFHKRSGQIPILAGDGMGGERRVPGLGGGYLPIFCRVFIVVVQCLSFTICTDPACLPPLPLSPHWIDREGSSMPTQTSC